MNPPTLAERFPGLTTQDMERLTYWKHTYRLRHDGFAPAEIQRLLFQRWRRERGAFGADGKE